MNDSNDSDLIAQCFAAAFSVDYLLRKHAVAHRNRALARRRRENAKTVIEFDKHDYQFNLLNLEVALLSAAIAEHLIRKEVDVGADTEH
ncbi:MAG: hypothetical protein ACK5LO_02460 [Leucobacter sp.]